MDNTIIREIPNKSFVWKTTLRRQSLSWMEGPSLLPQKQINLQLQWYPEFFKRLHLSSSSERRLKGNSFKQEDKLSNNTRKRNLRNGKSFATFTSDWKMGYTMTVTFFFLLNHWQIKNSFQFHYRFVNVQYTLKKRLYTCTGLYKDTVIISHFHKAFHIYSKLLGISKINSPASYYVSI